MIIIRQKAFVHSMVGVCSLLLPAGLAACFSSAVAQNVVGSPAAPPPSETRPAQRDEAEDERPIPNQPGMQVFQGSGALVNSQSPATNGAAAGDVTLDFSDADIREVVRVIFGDILKKSYTIDPKVTGHITLQTGTPIRQDDVLPALETALNILSAAIRPSQDVYNIVPIADAEHSTRALYSSGDHGAAGFGVEIVPLKYVSADEMQHVLKPLVPNEGTVQTDANRNLIFIIGTEPERASIRATIARFDVNYFKGMSFALVQPSHADAVTLAAELNKIFGEANSPISGLVRLVPIPRINNLLVITSRPVYLREVQRWIERLDIVPVTPDRKLHYYRLQNARAQDVALTLQRLFGKALTQLPMAPDAPSAPVRGNNVLSAGNPMIGARSTSQQPQSPPNSTPSDVPNDSTGGANGPQIVTDESNNALIIRADAADYAAIQDVIQEMDVTPSQVLVEATIAEITLNDTLNYGVEWYFQSKYSTATLSQDGKVATNFPGLGVTYTVPNVNVALSALGSLTNVQVLSSPKVLTVDNKAATIEVGDQIPIATQSSVSTTAGNAPIVSSIQQRDTGVILSVTPRIGNGGVVYLDVSQEVSSSTPTTTSNIDSPTIQQRRIHTYVAINDGATIALGGLIQRSDTTNNGGIPYLKDIPLFGQLFGTRSSIRGRTELLVFLTPKIVRNLPAALDATEHLKREMADVQDAMDRLETQQVPRKPW